MALSEIRAEAYIHDLKAYSSNPVSAISPQGDSIHRIAERVTMGTLWEALESVPDRRTKKGRGYALASIAGLPLAAMLAGANDLLAIHRFGRRLTPKGLEMLGIKRRKAPCHSTYHYVFRSIAASDLETALG